MDYKGYKIWTPTTDELADFYGQGFYPDFEKLNENEYLIVEDENGEVIDYYLKHCEKLEKIKYPILESEFGGRISPRNAQQFCAWDLVKRKDIPIKLITGRFGSGKSLCMIAGALEALQKGHFEKIVFVRNNVQVKDTESLGALPGDLYSKTLNWALPFCDHCGGIEGMNYLIEEGKLETIPLAFLRGRSLRNAIIYSMESENLTKEHIQLLMGRVDEGSELWLDGDIKQRDKVAFEKSQGLETMIERLAGNKYFGYVHLLKSERSPVAQLADLLD